MRRRKLTRRSFLGRVAGGVFAGGALASLAPEAIAHPYSDSDPSDGVGRGRRMSRGSGGVWPHSDTDVGRNSDPVGRAGRLGHYSDTDTGAEGDPSSHGRRITDNDSSVRNGRSDRPHYRVTITDTDRGQPHADPPGRGRRPPRGFRSS